MKSFTTVPPAGLHSQGPSPDGVADPRVLVADDDPAMLVLYEEALRQLGYTPLCVSTGREAITLYQREHPPLVILDVVMPEADGLDVCRQIRADEGGRDTFILIITGLDAPDTLQNVLDAGADDYLGKPVPIEQLRARIVIAERNIAQRLARRRAEEALARAQWLAGIGETSLALQHEVNNPLTALLGNAALLQSHDYSAAEERDFVDAIVEQAVRIGAVVQRLSKLKDPQSVSYVRGTRMLDLSPRDGSEPTDSSASKTTGADET